MKLSIKLFFVLMTVFLAGCNPSAVELADYLEGHWAGSGERLAWCVSFVRKNANDTKGELFISEAEKNGDEAGIYDLAIGTWEALRGARLNQITSRNFEGYLLFDMNKNQYHYTSSRLERRSAERNRNNRVTNCPQHQSDIVKRNSSEQEKI